jgi:hypothetical protein
MTLAGAVQTHTTFSTSPLTAQRSAEDGRNVVADEFSVVYQDGAPALLVRHQAVHPANSNYTPTPQTWFTPQQVTAPELQGARGFAVVTVGQSGRVLATRAVSASGEINDSGLLSAIATGVGSEFRDSRRHDHTVYLAFEVRRGELRTLGEGIVTLPMCCGPGGPGEPCGQVHCEEN